MLLVSHLFSTVRLADIIVVVDGGQIELMAAGGLYADLYEIQPRTYQ